MNPRNKKVANLLENIGLEDSLGEQVASFFSNYVLGKARYLFS